MAHSVWLDDRERALVRARRPSICHCPSANLKLASGFAPVPDYLADVFRAAGAEIRESWCGPCFGQGPDALAKGETAITSFNRNWANRMGVGGLGYLASPSVVAASALLGYMGPPSELGIEWKAERFV